jgi:hypothetical protein
LNTLKLHKELVQRVKEEMRIKFLLTEQLYAPYNRSLEGDDTKAESQILTPETTQNHLENNSH